MSIDPPHEQLGPRADAGVRALDGGRRARAERRRGRAARLAPRGSARAVSLARTPGGGSGATSWPCSGSSWSSSSCSSALIGPFLGAGPARHERRTSPVEPPPRSEHWFGHRPARPRRVRPRSSTASGSRCSSALVVSSSRPSSACSSGRSRAGSARWVDTVLMRFVDILLGIPYLVLAFALITDHRPGRRRRDRDAGAHRLAADGPDRACRLPPGQGVEYVEAARAVGVPARRIMAATSCPTCSSRSSCWSAVGVGCGHPGRGGAVLPRRGRAGPDPVARAHDRRVADGFNSRAPTCCSSRAWPSSSPCSASCSWATACATRST